MAIPYPDEERSAEGVHVRLIADRMGVVETTIGKHTKILEDNKKLTLALGERFDSFETSLAVERRIKDAELAVSLDKWKNFMILKVDEATAENKVIKDNQILHMKATEDVLSGLGDVLAIVNVMQGVKKTAGRFGRCGIFIGGWMGKTVMWCGGIAAAWLALLAAFTSNVKFKWPFL